MDATDDAGDAMNTLGDDTWPEVLKVVDDATLSKEACEEMKRYFANQDDFPWQDRIHPPKAAQLAPVQSEAAGKFMSSFFAAALASPEVDASLGDGGRGQARTLLLAMPKKPLKRPMAETNLKDSVENAVAHVARSVNLPVDDVIPGPECTISFRDLVVLLAVKCGASFVNTPDQALRWKQMFLMALPEIAKANAVGVTSVQQKRLAPIFDHAIKCAQELMDTTRSTLAAEPSTGATCRRQFEALVNTMGPNTGGVNRIGLGGKTRGLAKALFPAGYVEGGGRRASSYATRHQGGGAGHGQAAGVVAAGSAQYGFAPDHPNEPHSKRTKI